MRVYVCNSCGGEIVTDPSTAATSCPFCGNPVVMKEQLSGDLKPDIVIPFKLDKKAAKEHLLKHMSGKKLLPKLFKEESHLDEIKGVYVPFWLFDARTEGAVRYKATKVHTWSDGKYNYTETSYFNITREGSLKFHKVPVDGSRAMADDLMETIEPFRFEDALDFNTAYLAGFLANKYDVSAEESIGRAEQRMKSSTESAFAGTVNGYSTVTVENSQISYRDNQIKYALLPVWVLSTTYKGENYLYAMNGQTGKFAGNMPVDKGRYFKWLCVYGGIVAAAIYGLSLLFM